MTSKSLELSDTVTVAPSSERVVTITVAALTTTFTPPPECAEQRLTQLGPASQIWMNEPQPVEASKFSECYPSKWIEQYTSSAGWSTSIVPMFSPLVCPSGWEAVGQFENDYLACCPSSFNIALPTATSTDPNRPAYGGTCYSDLTKGNTYTLTKYNASSVVGTILWPATATTDQAYAHPIDGYREGAVLPTHTSSSSTSTASSSAVPTVASNSSASLSGGAIAGIVIGVVGGLALIAAAVFFLFRRRRQQTPQGEAGAGASSQPGEKGPNPYEAPDSPYSPPGELHGNHHAPGELGGNNYVAELGPAHRSELQGSYHGHEMR